MPLRSLVVSTGKRHTLAWDSFSNFFIVAKYTKHKITILLPSPPQHTLSADGQGMCCSQLSLVRGQEGLTGEVH